MDKRTLKSKSLKHIEQICIGYTNGMTLKELSSLYKLGTSTIRNNLIKNNVTLRKSGQKKKEDI